MLNNMKNEPIIRLLLISIAGLCVGASISYAITHKKYVREKAIRAEVSYYYTNNASGEVHLKQKESKP